MTIDKKVMVAIALLIVATIVAIIFIVYFNDLKQMTMIDIRECECGGNTNIQCPVTYRCIIYEGDLCGHCVKLGGGSSPSGQQVS